MPTYTTQMDAARKGIVTPQMEIVAKKAVEYAEKNGQARQERLAAVGCGPSMWGIGVGKSKTRSNELHKRYDRNL